MKEKIKKLEQNFLEIKNKEWIKSTRKGSTGIGTTFESLLGMPENNFEIPDYNGIEIKTKRFFSKAYITLFNSKPEGPHLQEIERLKNLYGYPDKILKKYKVLNNSVNTLEETTIGNRYTFRLNINREKEKIYLIIKNNKGTTLENKVYWDFDTIKEKLERKTKYLAFVEALKKTINNEEYFKYHKMTIYELKDFDTFISLLEKGIIRITFKISIFRDGKRKGQTHDHGTGFEIEEKNMLKLYNLYKKKGKPFMEF